MFEKVIEIYKDKKGANKPLLNIGSISYPTIPDNTSNFITDYISLFPSYDIYIARMWGQRNFDGFLSSDKIELLDEWDEAVKASVITHLEEWARLYYALSIKYNPIWNVDGTTTYVWGEKVSTDDIAYRKRTETIGNTETTATDYATAYDSGTEKETGKNVLEDDERENTFEDDAHLDTFTTEEHTDTETKQGNQGITMTQQLLTAEFELRKRSFFRTIFKTIIDECGCYYIEGEWK